MANLQRIAVRIEGDAAQFKRTLAESSQASRQFGASASRSFQRVSLGFKNLLGVGGALSFAAVGAAAIRASDQVSLGLRKIRVSATGTSQDLKGLEQAFDNVFARVPQDATEVGSVISGLNTILKAEGSILEDLSRKVLDASRLMGEDSAQNATLFARAMNQFNEKAERGSDVLEPCSTYPKGPGSASVSF